MRRLLARFGDLALWVTAILGVTAVAVSIGLAATSARPLIVTSGSMGDAYPVGSVTVLHEVDPDAVRKGDVLNVTRSNGVTALHRVVELRRTADGTVVRTKGDANATADAGEVLLVGAWRAGTHVPHVGRVAALLRTPFAGFALAVALLGPLALGSRRKQVVVVPAKEAVPA